MRFLALFSMLLALTACDVIAEIDAEIGFSEEELAKSKAKQAKQAKQEQDAAEAPAQTASQLASDWWGKARSLGPREDNGGDDAMVRCKVAGSERFTSRRDCLSTGGALLQ